MFESVRRAAARSFPLMLLAVAAGCRMSAPLHSWQPPVVASAVGRRVALPALEGPEALADLVGEKARGQSPGGDLRVAVLGPEALDESIRLVSSSEEGPPSDIAALAAARRTGADLLLRGEVLSRPVEGSGRQPGSTTLPDGRLAIAWKVIDVPSGKMLGGRPLTISAESAAARHPDLFIVPQPEAERLATASARDAWRLLAPHVERTEAKLALPWFTAGAERIRRGNAYAVMGRWPEAERQWQAVLHDHPSQHAAMHNLAVAAVARQDFDEARRLAGEAARMRPCQLYERTFAWVERRQRSYHEAFDLPDPPGGWRLAPPAAPEPESIDEAGEPQGWTAWAWLTQPIPL